MNTELTDYIKVFPKFIDADIVGDSLTALKETSNWQPNYFYNPATHSHETRSSNELDMSFDLLPTHPELMLTIRASIQSYLTDINLPWFTSWHGYSRLRYNRYEPGKEMSLHYDCIHELFDGEVKGVPTLSIIGALNDDYTGGELILCDQPIHLTAGDVLIFPSTFLYPHYVKPVTSGIRYSCVSWVW